MILALRIHKSQPKVDTVRASQTMYLQLHQQQFMLERNDKKIKKTFRDQKIYNSNVG